jgi:hypothetical protein
VAFIKGGGKFLGSCQLLNTMPREWQNTNTTNPNRLPKSSIATTFLLVSIGCTMVFMHECRHSCLGGGNRFCTCFCTCHINDSFCPMHSLPSPTTYHIDFNVLYAFRSHPRLWTTLSRGCQTLSHMLHWHLFLSQFIICCFGSFPIA